MKIISLLRALVIFSLIILPVCSQPSLKDCDCMPGNCPEKAVDNCAGQSSDSCISMSCTCPGQYASYQGMEYYNPSDSRFGKAGSRLPDRQGFAGPQSCGNAGALCPVPPASPNNNHVGPPDPDVVEFLPPSARQVFQVLASDGLLTQKDIISKTHLPPRTVRYALNRLRGEEMLQERFCFRDARQILYGLNGMNAR
jgi:hypothetical protein